jgi:hypothetical protein
MRFLLPLVLIVCFGAVPAAAQVTGNFGSIYSRFGIGDRVDTPSSQAAMMGGAGTATRSGVYASLSNPALWSDLSFVRLSFGAEMTGLQAEDASGATSRLMGTSLTGLQVAVPLINEELGVVIALRPYSRMNYRVTTTGRLIDPQLPRDTVDYRVNLEGDGGLQEAQLGFGWRVAPWLSLGASGRAVFGVVENRQRTEYLPPNQFGETRTMERTRMWGFGATVGAVATATGVLGDNDMLSFGTAFTLPTNMQARRVHTVGFSLDQDTLRTEYGGDARLPFNASFGVSYAPSARWLFSADLEFEPWTNFESDLPFVGYETAGSGGQLSDRMRVGGGFQVIPAGAAARDAGLLARSAYRFGAYYDQGYVAPRGHDVSTLALTGGVSLPGLLPGTRFDIGLEAGTRGATNDGLVRDLFLMGSATINFGERWFIRRQFG